MNDAPSQNVKLSNYQNEIPKRENFKKECIDKDFINLILENYHPQFRFIESVSVKKNECISIINVDKYPYAKESAFNYVTSTSISLILSQAVYIFVAELIRREQHSDIGNFTLNKFLSMRNNGDLLFTRNNFVFKRKLMRNCNFEFRVNLKALKRMRNFVCASLDINIENHLYGDAMLVAGPLDKYHI